MAAKLQCEICGGKLIGRPGGIFECENCGTEYSTEWAKAKIQEITGTVKVEGTVEVTGKVQVDVSSNKESMLQRAYLALEDAEWTKAEALFDQVLSLDSRNAEAYLGLAMAENKCQDREAVRQVYTHPFSKLRKNKYLIRARQFGREEISAWLDMLDEEAKRNDDAYRLEQLRIDEQERLAEERRKEQERVEEERRKEQERLQKEQDQLAREGKRAQVKKCMSMIAASENHTVGLRADGTVIVTKPGPEGLNRGQCNVMNWADIIAAATGAFHTVGLHADGTVIATEYTWNRKTYKGQCDVADWENIVAIAAGDYHTVGLQANGCVVAAGENGDGQCNVSEWKNIVSIDASGNHTVGVCSDGTVIATGSGGSGRCDVSDWTDIVAVSAGPARTVGLRSDGTVLAVGYNKYGQCNVNDWGNIVAVAAGKGIGGGRHTVGLVADGTVVAVGDNTFNQCDVSDWKDIVAVAASNTFTVGLRTDGTVVATHFSNTNYGQCDVSGWKLFNSLETVDAERQTVIERGEATKKTEKAKSEALIESLNKEKVKLQTELPTIKGLFAGPKKVKIETRLGEIEAELKKLG